jgi:RNA polymerase sigma-70 factor (ECF subfamily)
MAHSDILTIDDAFLAKCRNYLRFLTAHQLDSWLGQRIDASDIVQQTLLDAVSNQHRFRGKNETEYLAWLRRILTNNLVDIFRHHGSLKRDMARSVSLYDEITKSFRRVDALANLSGSTPSERVASNEELLRLAAALNTLPEAQRDAIVLHHLKGLKLSETSKRIGRSETAICGLLHRGLKRLNKILEE